MGRGVVERLGWRMGVVGRGWRMQWKGQDGAREGSLPSVPPAKCINLRGCRHLRSPPDTRAIPSAFFATALGTSVGVAPPSSCSAKSRRSSTDPRW